VLITNDNSYPTGTNVGTYRVNRGTVTSGAVVIPATYDDLPVTEIATRAFDFGSSSDGSTITSVSIPASITFIGQRAFYACGLHPGLTFSVTFAEGSQLATIDGEAFLLCESLASIDIPASVTSIGEAAFGYCKGLTSITVDAGNLNYSSEGPILYNADKTTLVAFPSASGSITIPDGVTSIGDGAFLGCSSVRDYIGISDVTIPASVTSIGSNAFQSCGNLASIIFEAGSQLSTIGRRAFAYGGLTNVTIPASVTSIDEEAFIYCSKLIGVTFATGSAVSSIGNNAFPQGSVGDGGNNLRATYWNATTGGAGTYTRVSGGSTWTKQP